MIKNDWMVYVIAFTVITAVLVGVTCLGVWVSLTCCGLTAPGSVRGLFFTYGG